MSGFAELTRRVSSARCGFQAGLERCLQQMLLAADNFRGVGNIDWEHPPTFSSEGTLAYRNEDFDLRAFPLGVVMCFRFRTS